MKPFGRSIRFAALALPILALLSCGEPSSTPTSPTGAEPSRSLLSLGTLHTLRRTQSVSEGWCATDVPVGPDGGVVECPAAGLRLEFPEGALPDTVDVSVDIPRGDLVGYEFEPHGIQFSKGVRLRQDLAGTEAEGSLGLLESLEGAYVTEVDDLVDPLEILHVDLLGSLLNGLDGTAIMKIRHFSGYVFATN